jgi:predicted transcriptional regulator
VKGGGTIGMAKVSIQIRIDPDLLDWVDEIASQADRSRSWIINDCLRQAHAQARDRRLLSKANLRNC